MRRLIFTLALLSLWLLGLTACQETADENIAPPTPAATPATAVTPASGTPETTSTLTPSAEIGATPPATAVANQLILWTSAEFAPRSELPGGQLLSAQLAAFNQDNPELTLEVQLKAPSGQGGTLSYLRAGRAVAPAILPDLILLSSDQLPTAVNERLVYPLGPYIGADMRNDLFPAAEQLARVDGQLMAYPFALTSLHHLAYNTAVITDTLPATWNGLLELGKGSLLLPANGPEGAELLLLLYLSAGGSLTNEAGQPDLQIEPLTVALNQINRGRASGLILLQSGSLTSVAEAWQLFQGGASSLTQTRSGIFLGQEGLANNWGYGPLPGVEQAAVPLVKSWVWAISTPDPARQAKAAELIVWLTAPENLGAWSANGHILPARRSALDSWTAPPDYLAFINGELARAQPYPRAATTAIMNALGEALFNVITLAASPQIAAEEAAEAVRQ